MTPLLSVIIPTYNAADYLAEAIGSALRQTVTGLEIVVVDDGSTDRTPDVLDIFTDHPRITILRRSHGGPSQARNAGLARARGRYVGFLDADDRWHRRKAERQLALLETHAGLDMVFSWWRVIDHDGADTGRAGRPRILRPGFEDLVRENVLGSASTVIARRSAIDRAGGFDPALQANVDLDLWLRIAALREGNIACLPKVLTDFRIWQGQIMQDWSRMAMSWDQVIDKARRKYPGRVAAVEREARARHDRYLAYLAYQAGDHGAARRLLRRAWRQAPVVLAGDRRTWLTSAAVAATALPPRLHNHLARTAKAARARSSAPAEPPVPASRSQPVAGE